MRDRDHRQRAPRNLRWDGGGRFFDTRRGDWIDTAALAGEVRDGLVFRAWRWDTGEECTIAVLLSLLGSALLRPSVHDLERLLTDRTDRAGRTDLADRADLAGKDERRER
ncbi:hypothetical protein ACGFNU_39615 [Spirillospora sp. NPDC048911]|uniref:hypothetical protein n=1 Tax=Spirillospora sp. NPDC048911 TaxID=3364527 RepID=UPI003714E533